MNRLSKLVIAAGSAIGLAFFAYGGSWSQSSSATVGYNPYISGNWNVNVPSTCNMYSRAFAFLDWGTASVRAGIAGPPAGLVHEAKIQQNWSTYGSYLDEKWTNNHQSGNFTVWHGGGVGGGSGSYIEAYTSITW